MAEPSLEVLLDDSVEVCTSSVIVIAYSVRVADYQVLSLRAHLRDGSFVDVFHNLASARIALALIAGGMRVYGKDNSHIVWHVHPYGSTDEHLPCAPSSFQAFLAEAEALRFAK